MHIGHVAFNYTRNVELAIHLAGHFDPTGKTKLVRLGVESGADLERSGSSETDCIEKSQLHFIPSEAPSCSHYEL